MTGHARSRGRRAPGKAPWPGARRRAL